MTKPGLGIGLSVGSTYACIAASKGDRNSTTGRIDAEIISSDAGDRVTPSVIQFASNQAPIVGPAARTALVRTPAHAVIGAKQILGLKFDDPAVTKYAKRAAVKIVEKDSMPVFEFDLDGKTEQHSVEDVNSYVYKKMREIGDAYLGTVVQKAVVTVPLDFDLNQRKAIVAAAAKANIDVLRLINEPIAAALAYGLDLERSAFKNVLVFDLGARSLDVSVITVANGMFRVNIHVKNDKVGGDAIDDVLINYFAQEFSKKNKVDVLENKRATAKLRAEVEPVKFTLSSSSVAKCSIESLYEGIDLNSSMNRGRFEILCSDIFKQCAATVQEALTKANLTAAQTDCVIMAGGGSRIPKMRSVLRELFDGREPLCSISPEEVFAVGAAIEASILANVPTLQENAEVTSWPALPNDIGVVDASGNFDVLIPRYTPLPAKCERVLSTSHENQTSVFIILSERQEVPNAVPTPLAQIALSDIKSAAVGVPKITLAIEVSRTGTLTASARDHATNGKSVTVHVKHE